MMDGGNVKKERVSCWCTNRGAGPAVDARDKELERVEVAPHLGVCEPGRHGRCARQLGHAARAPVGCCCGAQVRAWGRGGVLPGRAVARLAVVVVLRDVGARVAAEDLCEETERGGRRELAAAPRVALEEDADGARKAPRVRARPRRAHALVAERRHGPREQAPARARALACAPERARAVVAPHGRRGRRARRARALVREAHGRQAVHGARHAAAHGTHERREGLAERRGRAGGGGEGRRRAVRRGVRLLQDAQLLAVRQRDVAADLRQAHPWWLWVGKGGERCGRGHGLRV